MGSAAAAPVAAVFALLAWSGVFGGEVVPPRPLPAGDDPPKTISDSAAPHPLSIRMAGATTVTGRTMDMTRGVSLRLAGCEIDSASLHVVRSGDHPDDVIEHVEISPDGSAPDRVRLRVDSSKGSRGDIHFIGVLKPGRITIDRQVLEGDGPGVARFRVLIDDLDEIRGWFAQGADSIPLVGWARSAELMLLGDASDQDLTHLHLTALTLRGDESTRRPVWLAELPRDQAVDPLSVDLAEVTADQSRRKCLARSNEVTVRFKRDGSIASVALGADCLVDGMSSLGVVQQRH